MMIHCTHRHVGITRRRTLSLIGSGAGILAAPAFIGRAGAQEVYQCRIAHSEAISSPLTNAFEAWAQILREQSEGRIDAQHFPASQLGSYTQLIEGNRQR